MDEIFLIVPMLHQGGFERVCVQTARLLQNEYKVSIVIFSDKDINYDIEGLNVINLNVPSRRGKIAKVINLCKRVSKMKALRKSHMVSLCYSFGSTANYVNVLSGLDPRYSGKTVTGLRCSTDMEEKGQVRLFCKKSDRVLSCSKEITRELERDYKYKRSSYIYNPLDTSYIEKCAEEEIDDFPFEGENLKIFVSVGRQDYIKGFWHLLKAFSITYKKHDNARLIIIGTGNWEPYKKLSGELGIENVVAFMGLKKNPFPYVARSDVYVLSSNHEGFPNALLEGMALGKALIATDCKTGPREIILREDEYQKIIKDKPNGDSIDKPMDGAFGVLVPDMPDKVDLNAGHIIDGERVLSDEMNKMIEDENRMLLYKRAAKIHSKSFSPMSYARDLKNLLDDIIYE